MSFSVIDHGNDNARAFESRAEAEDKAKNIKMMVNDPSAIEVVQGAYDDYETFEEDSEGEPAEQDLEPEIVDHAPSTDGGEVEAQAQETTEAIDKLGESLEDDPLNVLQESIDDDPLDILPSYMITQVEGKPSLNKRGVSVLAYHYNISVVDKEVVAYPHETEYESCYVNITVTNGDGQQYVGAGEAVTPDVDRDKLLRMAETRAYKRAVIFATGTGIVGYQEMVNSLE